LAHRDGTKKIKLKGQNAGKFLTEKCAGKQPTSNEDQASRRPISECISSSTSKEFRGTWYGNSKKGPKKKNMGRSRGKGKST